MIKILVVRKAFLGGGDKREIEDLLKMRCVPNDSAKSENIINLLRISKKVGYKNKNNIGISEEWDKAIGAVNEDASAIHYCLVDVDASLVKFWLSLADYLKVESEVVICLNNPLKDAAGADDTEIDVKEIYEWLLDALKIKDEIVSSTDKPICAIIDKDNKDRNNELSDCFYIDWVWRVIQYFNKNLNDLETKNSIELDGVKKGLESIKDMHSGGIHKEQSELERALLDGSDTMKKALRLLLQNKAELSDEIESIEINNKISALEVENENVKNESKKFKQKAIYFAEIIKKMRVEAEELQETIDELQNEFRNEKAQSSIFLKLKKVASSLALRKSWVNNDRLYFIAPSLNKNFNLIKQSEYFDPEWYLTNYSDVKESGADPVKHYLMFGGSELRDPSIGFSTSLYLKNNPDVEESGINPLVHYLTYGFKEEREIYQSDLATEYQLDEETHDEKDEEWVSPISPSSYIDKIKPYSLIENTASEEFLIETNGCFTFKVVASEDDKPQWLDRLYLLFNSFEIPHEIKLHHSQDENDVSLSRIVNVWLSKNLEMSFMFDCVEKSYCVQIFQYTLAGLEKIDSFSIEKQMMKKEAILINPFMPVVIFSLQGEIVFDCQILHFPSLLTGGLHNPDTLFMPESYSLRSVFDYSQTIFEQYLKNKNNEVAFYYCNEERLTGIEQSLSLYFTDWVSLLFEKSAFAISDNSLLHDGALNIIQINGTYGRKVILNHGAMPSLIYLIGCEDDVHYASFLEVASNTILSIVYLTELYSRYSGNIFIKDERNNNPANDLYPVALGNDWPDINKQKIEISFIFIDQTGDKKDCVDFFMCLKGQYNVSVQDVTVISGYNNEIMWRDIINHNISFSYVNASDGELNNFINEAVINCVSSGVLLIGTSVQLYDPRWIVLSLEEMGGNTMIVTSPLFKEKKKGKVQMVFCGHSLVERRNENYEIRLNSRNPLMDYADSITTLTSHPYLSCINKELWKKVGGLDEGPESLQISHYTLAKRAISKGFTIKIMSNVNAGIISEENYNEFEEYIGGNNIVSSDLKGFSNYLPIIREV